MVSEAVQESRNNAPSLLALGLDPDLQVRCRKGVLQVQKSHHEAFCYSTVSSQLAHVNIAPSTQIRQHAPEDGESGGRLLVQLEECSPRQALQVLKRTGRRCRHDEDLRDPASLWREMIEVAVKSCSMPTVRQALRPLCAVPGMGTAIDCRADRYLSNCQRYVRNCQDDSASVCQIGELYSLHQLIECYATNSFVRRSGSPSGLLRV